MPEGPLTPGVDGHPQVGGPVTDERFPTCREVVAMITDYLEGRMDGAERGRFERHIDSCDGCATYLEQMRLTIRATRALADDAIPASQREDLVAAFRELFRESGSHRPRRPRV